MSDDKRTIEIGGVKVEVDLRTAKTIESYKVGDSVKVLVKEYSDTYACYPGIIIGFSNFSQRPAIEIMYLKDRYSEAEIKVKTITADSEDIELAPFNEYETQFDRARILGKFDTKIAKLEEEIRQLQNQKTAFNNFFGAMIPKENFKDNEEAK